MKLRRTALALSAAAVLAAPASADALIQVTQGIAGARIGNTQGQVRAALGNPFRVVNGTNEFGPWREFRYRFGVRVFFQGRDRVTSVSTNGLGDRTRGGIGVGSREGVVRSIRGIRCETLGALRVCQIGRSLPGRRVTAFRLRNGRVRSVSVGIVID